MYLGIEIGGTKLQLGVGPSSEAKLVELVRREVDRAAGAAGILRQIAELAPPLVAAHQPRAAGIGFGGPVDAAGGSTLRSHHVGGWDDFPLVESCQKTLGLDTVIGNDADVAALAEARYGAGRDTSRMLYVTVGTGIGAGFVIDGSIYRGHGPAAIELGHLRPGIASRHNEEILEALAAGWGIAAQARARMQEAATGDSPDRAAAAELLRRAGGRPQNVTAKLVAQAASAGNALACDVFDGAVTALGWGLAQAITLLAPERIVIGGGVALAGEALFFEPLRQQVETYVFPPLRASYEVVPAALGEEMVVYGAIALAAGNATRG